MKNVLNVTKGEFTKIIKHVVFQRLDQFIHGVVYDRYEMNHSHCNIWKKHPTDCKIIVDDDDMQIAYDKLKLAVIEFEKESGLYLNVRVENEPKYYVENNS